MAVSHVVKVAAGNDARSAMSEVKMDSNDTLLSGTAISLTIDTSLDGVAVDASAALTYTSTEDQTPKQLIQAFCEYLSANLTGARAWFALNMQDNVRDKDAIGEDFVVHVLAEGRIADVVNIGTPTFVPGV